MGLEKFKSLGKLGQGTHGMVYKAQNTNTGDIYINSHTFNAFLLLVQFALQHTECPTF